jgi:hypothetical protein
MARCITITPSKTYASEINVIRAVEKIYPLSGHLDRVAGLSYIICRTADNRFYPLFIGERAVSAMAHFHFNCIN